MERYPALSGNGEITGYVISSVEFSVVFNPDGSTRGSYLWIDTERAVRIDSFIEKGLLVVDDIKIEYARLVEDIPWPLVYVAWDLDEYVDWIYKQYSEKLEGKTVVVNFSGGKDSTSVLAIMARLRERVRGLKVYAVYSYVPYLEPPRNIDFSVKTAEKLGVEIEVVEADRELMKKRLLEEGLPYRGKRWCTYMKLRPIKQLKKARRPEVTADGDRMTEAFKRFNRLYRMSPQHPRIYDGGRIRPIYIWTILDIVKNVRELGLVHPDYYDGLPRVACLMCPYKALHEFSEKEIDILEDPGLIEDAIKTSYRRYYTGTGIPWEEFRSQHLWRHHPVVAKKLYTAKKILDSMNLEEVDRDTIESMYKSLWTNPLPEADRINPDDAVKVIGQMVATAYEEAVAKAREAARLVQAERLMEEEAIGCACGSV